MTVHAEQSRLNVVGGDLGFFFDKSRADNQLLVADGETAVIGGLTQTQVIRNRSGIPILSDLPLIGKLFSQTRHPRREARPARPDHAAHHRRGGGGSSPRRRPLIDSGISPRCLL